MKCQCGKKAVLENPRLCKEHFIQNFEKKFSKEIDSQDIEGNVCVAASGGKDSTVLLYLLNKFGIKVTALAVDEGIEGYRDESLENLRSFCETKDIPLNTVSFQEEFNTTLDNIVKVKKHSCSYCGVLRRKLLNDYSQEYDMIATGHNLDDESQAALMNLLSGKKELLPGGKREVEGLTRRVKPLKYCSEKEVMTYAFIKGLNVDFNECPNLKNSFREQIRDMLNELEKERMVKANILRKYDQIQIEKEPVNNFCEVCKTPTRRRVCNACKVVEEVKAI